jgi:hypothetical protein
VDVVLKNELKRLSYQDPEKALKETAFLRAFTSATPLSPKRREWRHHSFENPRESEQAAWFAYGLKAIGVKPGLQFAHFRKKDRDFDAALRWGDAGSQVFATVQIKEVVPSELRPSATLQEEVAKFDGYTGTDDLIGAILVNRDLVLSPEVLKVPALRIRELWIYGFSGQKELQLFMLGDLLRKPQEYTVAIPSLRWKMEDLPWRGGKGVAH